MLTKKPSWRENYNPIRGLTMTRLVGLEDSADRGQPGDLQWFYYHMERSDVTIQAAVARRLAFLDSVDWEIRQVENADPALATEQADFLRYAYDRIANFKEASRNLARSLFNGYAILEKSFTGYGNLVNRLDLIEPWYWIRPQKYPDWRFNPDARSTEQIGEAVQRDHLCIMESPPLFRAIGRHFFCKSLAFADWDQALETCANQSIFFIGPPGTTEEKELEYRNIAEQLASNGRGYLPNGTDVKLIDTATRSRLPYFDRIQYCDEQIVLAATGGLLTMLTESGSGTLAGGAHSEALLDLARSDAARLSEVFQNDLDKPWLAEFFPHQPVAAYFTFDIPRRDDPATTLQAVSALSWAGYSVEQKQLEEKLGLRLVPLPKPGAPQ